MPESLLTGWHQVCYKRMVGINNRGNPMKKNQQKLNRANYSLGDLIAAVSSSSKNNRETLAAVADLIESGRVRFQTNGRKIRGHVY
jgi:alpha-amylase/alpha-mannosidase (GH57 family)